MSETLIVGRMRIFTYRATDKLCRELTENPAPFHLHIQQDEHTRHRGAEEQKDAERERYLDT